MSDQVTIHPFLLQLITKALKKGASDLHLKAGIVPVIRVLGSLRPLESSFVELSSRELDEITSSLLDSDQMQDYKKNKEVDLGLGIPGVGRFRVNIFKQRGSARIVIRNIPHVVPSIDDLNLPKIIKKIAEYERGLVLVTGVTGSGKSSTMAAIVDHINRNKNKHILTIEDPIEYLIRDSKSIVTQRELGMDARSFSTALRAALRQDPDIILIGEMRDRETIETALVAAETGHLVISTLHTLDARETINRILSAFDPHHQQQIRLQISSVLQAVISQRLARREDKEGFIPVVEVMINNARIRDMIEDPMKTKDIPTAIHEGRSHYGMQTFDQCLLDLVKSKVISVKTALEVTNNPEDFKVHLGGFSKFDQDRRWREESIALQNKAWERIKDVELVDDKTHLPPPVKNKKVK